MSAGDPHGYVSLGRVLFVIGLLVVGGILAGLIAWVII